MPQLSDKLFTSEDYWNLPKGERAELIGGKLYYMAPPNRIHQKISYHVGRIIGDYILVNGGACEVYHAPFAVNLNADDTIWVEPDISVICDKNKLTDRGCNGAPDFIVEIVSPSSRRMDYLVKSEKYEAAGVREYWVIDPVKECTTVFRFEEDVAPVVYSFAHSITVGIYGNLSINIAEIL